jgi:hypothetical protein
MEPRVAQNLLEIMRPELERANALLEAARALAAVVAAGKPAAPLPPPAATRSTNHVTASEQGGRYGEG